jgi:hypothetical protein
LDVRKAIYGTAETAIVGQALDPFTGRAPSGSTAYALVRLKNGTTNLVSDYVNRGGSYEMTNLPSGAIGTGRNLSGERAGYITTLLRYPITITSGIVRGPYMDALPAARTTGYATLLFDWKTSQPANSVTGCTGSCLGWEFDLFVKTPSGSYIGFGNGGDLLTSPYVKWPRDSVDDLLPMEVAVIAPSAANGTYKVFVDKYPYSSAFNQNWAGSSASFQAYSGAAGTSSGHFYDKNCTTYRYWYVGDLAKSGSTYTWTTKNTCTNTRP